MDEISLAPDGRRRSGGRTLLGGAALIGAVVGSAALAQEAAVGTEAEEEAAVAETEAESDGTLLLDALDVTAAPGRDCQESCAGGSSSYTTAKRSPNMMAN